MDVNAYLTRFSIRNLDEVHTHPVLLECRPQASTFKERMDLKRNLVECYSIDKIQSILTNKYRVELEHTLFTLEILYSIEYIYYYFTKQPPPKHIEDWWNNSPTFFIHFYIRLVCLSNGWSSISIESFINRYFPYHIKENIHKHTLNSYYIYFKLCFKELDTVETTKGRPRIPNELKDIIERQRCKKNNIILTQGYHLLTTVKQPKYKDCIQKLKDLVHFSENSQTDKELLLSYLSILEK